MVPDSVRAAASAPMTRPDIPMVKSPPGDRMVDPLVYCRIPACRGLAGVLLVLSAVSATGDDGPPRTGSDDPPEQTVRERPAELTGAPEPISLLEPKSLQTDEWVFVSEEKTPALSETWTIANEDADPILVCKGMPYGYLRTRRAYDDFEMELEWRFPHDVNGNSGILLYTAADPKVWPKAIQIQLHQPVAGSVFPSGDARCDNELRNIPDLARPVNQWNVCRISSIAGTISVEINGKQVGEVTGCRPSSGAIGLQSEGSEVHFRRIRIRETPPMAAPDVPEDQHTGWWSPRCRRRVHQFGTCPPALFAGYEISHRHTRVSRHSRPAGKATDVVYREPLAAHGDLHRRGDCLCLEVVGPSGVGVARRGDRLHRADRRHLGF
jgi:hypothetical protein